MPIYEYQCSLCGHHFDALQKTDDKPLTLCPACKKEGLIKLVSAASFQLKGTGWYATDFRTKPDQKAAANAENPKKEELKDNTTTTKEASGPDTSTKDTKSTDAKSSSGNNGEAA